MSCKISIDHLMMYALSLWLLELLVQVIRHSAICTKEQAQNALTWLHTMLGSDEQVLAMAPLNGTPNKLSGEIVGLICQDAAWIVPKPLILGYEDVRHELAETWLYANPKLICSHLFYGLYSFTNNFLTSFSALWRAVPCIALLCLHLHPCPVWSQAVN